MPSGSVERSVSAIRPPRGARSVSAIRARLFDPVVFGSRSLPGLGLILLAAIGGALLLVLATTSWQVGSDEQAYWRAAQRLAAGGALYDPTAVPNTPFAYWYPPPLAQLLAPLTSLISPEAFSLAWTLILLTCLWWLGGRNVLVALALVAFLPVAVELRTRNVHLVLAVLVVLALRRSWVFWVPAAAIKIAPVLGAVYLLAAGRVREAIGVGLLGGAVLVVSVVLAPDAWRDFVTIVGARAGTDGGALVAIPYPVRFGVGAVLAGIGGRLGGLRGEMILVVGLTIANPTLWVAALSLLVAIVPLVRTRIPERPPVSQPRVALADA
jgi:hypothetical protein